MFDNFTQRICIEKCNAFVMECGIIDFKPIRNKSTFNKISWLKIFALTYEKILNINILINFS